MISKTKLPLGLQLANAFIAYHQRGYSVSFGRWSRRPNKSIIRHDKGNLLCVEFVKDGRPMKVACFGGLKTDQMYNDFKDLIVKNYEETKQSERYNEKS